MPPSKAQNRPQTIKQAKKAFKARGQPAISSAERRQIERNAELQERAERIKEQEKRKREFLRKKEERELKEKHAQREAVRLGTQRRLDKFGYKSSQFHLGTFLKPKAPALPKLDEVKEFEILEKDDEEFDDDTLLEAALDIEAAELSTLHTGLQRDGKQDVAPEVTILRSSPIPARPRRTNHQPTAVANSNPLPSANAAQAETTEIRPAKDVGVASVPSKVNDLFDWDWLESSTQIARELSTQVNVSKTVELQEKHQTAPESSRPRIPSFNFGDLDLSEEDLEALDTAVEHLSQTTQQSNERQELNKKLMPLRRYP
ncbi:hypothetical protein H2203_006776 [Taxawa tesnikishii (nom. ined.)]|nr:hypothetical protein H2203_006776 [Dothideales sp. JES 119]